MILLYFVFGNLWVSYSASSFVYFILNRHFSIIAIFYKKKPSFDTLLLESEQIFYYNFNRFPYPESIYCTLWKIETGRGEAINREIRSGRGRKDSCVRKNEQVMEARHRTVDILIRKFPLHLLWRASSRRLGKYLISCGEIASWENARVDSVPHYSLPCPPIRTSNVYSYVATP